MALTLYDIKRAVHPRRKGELPDDFRILDSWTEYEEDPGRPLTKWKLKYLWYFFETVDPYTGRVRRLYKALKFARVYRVPAGAKQSTSLMDMQEKVLAAMWGQNVKMVTVIANVLEPQAIGLLYLYGVQGVATDMETARTIVDHDFKGLIASLQGKFRVLEMSPVVAEETEWLRKKLYHMEHMTVVRGIPWAEKAGEDAGNKGVGGKNVNPDSQGTLEDLISAMVSYEYVLQILCVPVPTNTLEGWQREIQDLATEWYPSLQGQESVGFNVSIPMMYGANLGQAQGWSKGYSSNATESFSQGQTFGTSDGQNVGRSLTQSFGQSVGTNIGRNISTSHTLGTSTTRSFGRSENFGESVGTSYTQSQGVSHTVGRSEGVTVTQGHTVGQNSGWNASVGQNASTSQNVGLNHSASKNIGFNQGSSLTHNQNIGKSSNFGQSFGISENANQGINTGWNQNASVSQGRTLGESHGTSTGNSYTFGHGQNEGSSHTVGQGQNVNLSQSQNAGYGASATHGTGNSRGITNGFSDTLGTSQTDSYSSGMSASSSRSHSAGTSMSDGWSKNVSTSDSTGISASAGTNISSGANASAVFAGGSTSGGKNDSASLSQNASVSGSDGLSGSVGYNTNDSVSQSFSMNRGASHSAGLTHSSGVSAGSSAGTTESTSLSNSTNYGYGSSLSQGASSNESFGTSSGASLNESFGANVGRNDSMSTSQNLGMSNSIGQSQGMSMSQGHGSNMGISMGTGTNASVGMSSGTTQGTSMGMSESDGTSMGYGASQGMSMTQGLSGGTSISDSLSVGRNYGTSESFGTNQSESFGRNYGQNHSVGYNEGVSAGTSESVGETYGQSIGRSVSDTSSVGYGQNVGESRTVSTSRNTGTSRGTSTGISNGTNGSTSLGTSASFGLSAGFSYSRSNQWMNQGVKDLLEILEYANNRAKKALRGSGMFETHVYLGCSNMDALSAAQAAAKSTWQNEWAMVQPLQVLDLSEAAQQHMLPRMYAFSADMSMEDVYGRYQPRYATALLPDELVAYTHLPRISEGGIFSVAQDIPKFSAPANMGGEVYMGTVINPERYDFLNGYMTKSDYRIDESMLMHGCVTGASRSGKTVAAMRLVAELAQVRRKKTQKRMRIVVMDPKQDWRALAMFVEPGRFRFGSLGNPDFMPVKLNIWKVPHGVRPQSWIDGIIDIYCRAYGLLERGKQMIAEVVYGLYKKYGVMDIPTDEPGWEDKVWEASANVSFEEVYKDFEASREKILGRGKNAGNQTIEGFDRLLERLSCFSRPFSVEYKLYGTKEGMCIDELIGADDVTVLESKGLEPTFKNFVFGAITAGFYKYAYSHDGGFLAPDQYETLLVLEEANEVLIGNDTGKKGSDVSLPGQSIFEEMLDQSAGFGLFVMAVTQKIADMPSSIVANCGMLFAGRLARQEDVGIVVRSIGREERIDDRDTVKWFPRSPIGWFVCKMSRGYSYLDAEPVLVKIAQLNVRRPTNEELEEVLAEGRAARLNMQNTA